MYSTLRGIKNRFSQELVGIYPKREIDNLFFRTAEFVLGKSKTQTILDYEYELSADQETETRDILNRLLNNEPIQYIDNQAFFFGESFFVDSSVLIPRPETEELVQLILDDNPESHLTVLDIGTGSGIIPISLAKRRPNWEVFACDVSNEALVVARRNSRELIKSEAVAFYMEDILQPTTQYDQELDIIVSNPPYVASSEMAGLESGVRDHEPHLALDGGEQGTEVIERLIPQAAQRLRPGGWLLMEVGPSNASRVEQLVAGHDSLSLHDTIADLAGHPRVVQAQKVALWQENCKVSVGGVSDAERE